MILRQSMIKDWMRCPLAYRFRYVDELEREQSSALSFGTVLHDAVFVMENAQDLNVGLDRFRSTWNDLSILDVEYDYLLPRKSHQSYQDDGVRILEDWWALIQWEADLVLAREHPFLVQIGDHELSGTADKIALRQLKHGEWVILVSDYKTNSKVPTREYLSHDLQFSAYCYASTLPEFWTGIDNGMEVYERFRDARRVGEWVHLRGPRRIDAGERNQVHYNRLRYAVDGIAESVACGIFVPTISGEACEFCDFRRACGLPSLEEETVA
jgi:hypothetical protein